MNGDLRGVTEPPNHHPMLAGLIFAIEEAEDRPGTLAATLPFGGMTLLEYQVRLLAGAGAEQVMVAVGRMTPALVAAVNRAVKRGMQVEVVRSAEEASERVDPDALVLVMADGLVTTDPVVERMAAEDGEALLVTDDPNSAAAIERLDMRDSWAGMARVSGESLGEIARMPADYDFQSALLRVAVQAAAAHVPMTQGWLRNGHSIEFTAEALAARSTAVLAALTERRRSWADRFLFTPIARLALPEVTARNVPGWTLLAAGSVFGAGALTLTGFGLAGAGLVVSLLAVVLLATGAAHAALVGLDRRAITIELGTTGLAAAMVLGVGVSTRIATGSWTALVLALAAIGCQALAERAPVRHRRWWSSPVALLVLLTPLALAGYVEAGLAGIALYAFATAAAAVEATREKP